MAQDRFDSLGRRIHDKPRDAVTGRFVTPPGKQPQQRRLPDPTLVRDQRSVLARAVKNTAATLRDALRQRGKVITAPIDLQVVALARIAVRLEIVSANLQNAEYVDDDQLVRLSNALARGLRRLGIERALDPPKPVTPVPSLAVLQQRHGAP